MQVPETPQSFPAILLMGPPHSGKSVLAHWLTSQLRKQGIAHFLLRTAPDGEGNWFHEGAPGTVVPLRLNHKGRYTPQLVRQMLNIVQARHLPLLVDMGGKPRGEQRRLMAVCTHGVLLYRTEEQRRQWRRWLAEEQSSLQLLAELRSDLEAEESITATTPHLRGVIRGLHRHTPYRPGSVGQQLLKILTELLNYDEATLAAFHRRTVPQGSVFVHLNDLARLLGYRGKASYWWKPDELPAVLARISPGPYALYGPGPGWLTAALAVHAQPRPVWLFDAHLGWAGLPPVQARPMSLWRFQRQTHPEADFVTVHLAEPFIPWGPIPWPLERSSSRGVVLSGKLPRWAFASWARYLTPARPWVALWDPRLKAAVVVSSRREDVPVGSVLFRT